MISTTVRGATSPLVPTFLTPTDWRYIIDSLKLSPQQSRIVSLILQGKQDKEIAAELGLNRYTIRTYLRRVFDRVGLQDRVQLILHIFALYSHRKRKPERPAPSRFRLPLHLELPKRPLSR